MNLAAPGPTVATDSHRPRSHEPLFAALDCSRWPVGWTGDREAVGAVHLQGRYVDRSAAGEGLAALHSWSQLPRLEPDRPGDRRVDTCRQPRRRCARGPDDPGKPVSRKGAGREGDHGPSVVAGTCRPDTRGA